MTDAATPNGSDAPTPAEDAKAVAETPREEGVVAGVPAWIILGGIALLVLGLALGRASAPTPPAVETADAAPAVWTCSMHPNIQLPEFGACPVCGMDLIPLEEGSDPGPRAYALSELAAAVAEVETAAVRRRAVSREVRMVGKVRYDETRRKYITAWIPGRLDRLFVDYTGTLVREGDHLMDIYSPELLTAQEELLGALAARRELAGASSKLLVETADATVASAREKLRLWGLSPAQVKAIEDTGKVSDHVTVHAPIGGVVVEKTKHEGDYVKTGERVFAIADLSRLWVKLDAYESDLAWVRIGQEVRFEVEAYPGEPFTGKVVFIDPALDPVSHTAKVRLNVENPDRRLKPEMFVRAVLRSPLGAAGETLDPSLAGKWICPMHWEVIKDGAGACDECGMALVEAESLHRGQREDAELPLVVPASAVLWTGTRSLVYVRRPGEEPVFEGRVVVLGPRAGDDYVIRGGLEEGEQVVVRGAFKIDSALQIQAKPSMMLGGDEGAGGALSAPAAFREGQAAVVAAALRVQRALADDDVDGARAGLLELAKAVEAVDRSGLGEEALRAWAPLAKQLGDAARTGAEAADIAAVRAAFYPLSKAALSLVRRFGVPGSGALVEAYCPMARDDQGAPWLQEGTEIDNPYFGASMLRCGEVRETFAAPGAPAPDPAPEEGSGSSLDLEPDEGAEQAAQADPFAGELKGLLLAYLKLQRALAADRADGAVAAEVEEALRAVRATPLDPAQRALWNQHRPRLVAAAAGRGDLRSLRVAFDGLSQSLIPLIESARPGPTVRRMRCSMAFKGRGADWLQSEETLANPYFGSRMLRCGDTVATIPGGKQ